MICGALQTLNEEAFEDVLGSERPSPTGGPTGKQLVQFCNTAKQAFIYQQTTTFTSNHLLQLQAGKQSQLTPIKEGTEHINSDSRGGAVHRSNTSHSLTNNANNTNLLSGSFSNIAERFNNTPHSNQIAMHNHSNHIPTHSVNSYAIVNHPDDPIPTVIVMPSSLENIHNDDTRLQTIYYSHHFNLLIKMLWIMVIAIPKSRILSSIISIEESSHLTHRLSCI